MLGGDGDILGTRRPAEAMVDLSATSAAAAAAGAAAATATPGVNSTPPSPLSRSGSILSPSKHTAAVAGNGGDVRNLATSASVISPLKRSRVTRSASMTGETEVSQHTLVHVVWVI